MPWQLYIISKNTGGHVSVKYIKTLLSQMGILKRPEIILVLRFSPDTPWQVGHTLIFFPLLLILVLIKAFIRVESGDGNQPPGYLARDFVILPGDISSFRGSSLQEQFSHSLSSCLTLLWLWLIENSFN